MMHQAAYTMESNNSYKSPLPYLPGERLTNAVRGGKVFIGGTEGNSCNLGSARQISTIEGIASNLQPDSLQDLKKKLDEIFKLPQNWDGRGTAAPNALAYLHAWDIIGILTEINLVPPKLVPSAEEGIVIFFTNEKRYGFVECYNEGEIVVAISDREGFRKIWQIRDTKDEIKDALEILRDFVSAS